MIKYDNTVLSAQNVQTFAQARGSNTLGTAWFQQLNHSGNIMTQQE